jgi:hypothetical protein
MKSWLAAWILLMTPSSSFATRSASKKRLTKCFSPFAHLAVLALIFSSSLSMMRRVCIRLVLRRTRYGLKSETGAPGIQKTIGRPSIEQVGLLSSAPLPRCRRCSPRSQTSSVRCERENTEVSECRLTYLQSLDSLRGCRERSFGSPYLTSVEDAVRQVADGL